MQKTKKAACRETAWNAKGIEWMAVPKDTDVYLETVETAQYENEKTNRGLGVASHYAATVAYDRKGYCSMPGTKR